MEIQVFEANNGDCPYLDNRKWLTYMFNAEELDGGIYESLLDYGFRRSGTFFYKNKCPSCAECIPLRVPINSFRLSKSQKRVWKRNADIRIETNPVGYDEESFHLYKRYNSWKHHSKTTEDNYRDFLIISAVDTRMMRYYLADELVGIGWIDMLPNAVSSVYFAFSPSHRKRSLGVYSVLQEIELAKKLRKSYLHLGFWVDQCQAMAYKKLFRPYQILAAGEWVSNERIGTSQRR